MGISEQSETVLGSETPEAGHLRSEQAAANLLKSATETQRCQAAVTQDRLGTVTRAQRATTKQLNVLDTLPVEAEAVASASALWSLLNIHGLMLVGKADDKARSVMVCWVREDRCAAWCLFWTARERNALSNLLSRSK